MASEIYQTIFQRKLYALIPLGMIRSVEMIRMVTQSFAIPLGGALSLSKWMARSVKK